MKTSIKSAVIGAIVVAVAVFALTNLSENRARAAQSNTAEEYKVVQMQTEFKRAEFEAYLNALGKEGWKVRTSVGMILILAR